MIYSRKVNFYETDAQGVVHHSNYPRYFEEARGFYLESLGYPYEKIRKELNIDIILLELKVRYKNPLFFGDIFKVDFYISDMDRFFFTFKYTVKKENTVIATGETKHACINRDNRKIVSIPDILRI
ncbi:acyl-CoA thioester hydrolase [Persephonella hydrogeniphila]|uniref:Acyl-CoA thioester hydrolase n=1 Tax=Persephonella hydrogeniphila TaxID=198703 RepID=A0A285N2E2_9AQUI|nr:thioesterase family protein [Persephonella hydrogeniphila]SNZ03113.1 acyl-CoA thioester hydrolase [Persephonella hydrogeniphila]